MSTQGDAKLAAASLVGLEEKFTRLHDRIKSQRQQLQDFDAGIFSRHPDEERRKQFQADAEASWKASPVSKGQARHALDKALSLNDAEILPTTAALLAARMAAWKSPEYRKYYPLDVIEAVENYSELKAAMAQYCFDSVDEVSAALDHYRQCRSDV